jgi:transcriptional regulator GlxA family with amidase domain
LNDGFRRTTEPLGGTYNVSIPAKQLNINAPETGTDWDTLGVARRKTDRRRKAVLRAAEQAVRARYAEFDLTLADIAQEVGMSPRSLQRIFREVGGTEFRAHLLRLRLETAHRLLSHKTDGLTIRATAHAVGYRQSGGLRQAFVKFYGYPPSTIQPEPPQYLGTLDEPEITPPVEWIEATEK